MSASWKGGLSLIVNGMPVTFGVELHKTQAKSADGFKMLDPHYKKPIRQVLINCEGGAVARSDTLKGIELGGEEFAALTPEQAERIEAGGRSQALEPLNFAPVASLPLDRATANYAVLPDAKAPGSESSVNALWNGLRAAKVAFISILTVKKADAILAVYAAEDGLRASTLPFLSELAQLPAFKPEINKQQATLVKGAIERDYEVKPFDPSEYVSTYAQRRQAVIDEVLAGVEPTEQAKPITPTDLMAALTESQANIGKAVAKPKRKARAKA